MKYRCLKYLMVLTALTLSVIGVITINTLANEISFTASAPKVVRSGEQFQIVYTLNNQVDDFTPPDFGEFQYLGGPSTGSSTSINMVNGKTTRTSSYTFTYYIQAPSKGGTYTLPPAKANYRRNSIQSNTLKIEVVGAQGTAGNTGNNSGNKSSSSAQADTGEEIFVRLEFDKTNAYVGEQITAWVKIYTKVNISGFDQQFKGPNFAGFYKQDVEIPPLSNLEREKVGNDIYHTGVIQKYILYPQKSGDITIEPFDLLVEIQKQTRRRSQSIFDDFFSSPYQRQRLNLKSNRAKLKINSLPGNQPANYSGAVGSFSISSSVSTNEVNTNDAVTFKVTVSGKGNIKLIDKLVTGFPPAFDVFEPEKNISLNKNNLGRSGKVVFEYTAIPRHAGSFEITPFSMAYFDIQANQYKTLSTQSYFIKVNRSDSDSTEMVSSNLSKEEIELLGTDIRYIKTNTKLMRTGKYLFGNIWFYGAYIIMLLLLVTVIIVRKEQIRRSADKVKMRNRRAAKITSRRLKNAQTLLKANDKIAFIDELERALWLYLSDKLNIPLSELSKEKALEVLSAKGLEKELADSLFSITDTCQYIRFAPGGMESELSKLFSQTQDVFRKIDQSL